MMMLGMMAGDMVMVVMVLMSLAICNDDGAAAPLRNDGGGSHRALRNNGNAAAAAAFPGVPKMPTLGAGRGTFDIRWTRSPEGCPRHLLKWPSGSTRRSTRGR